MAGKDQGEKATPPATTKETPRVPHNFRLADAGVFAIVRRGGAAMGLEPNYIVIDGQTFSKTKLALDNHVYKNCQIDDCDLYYSGGQYELLDTHITNSRLILNHPAKGIYNALQIFKMKSPGSRIIFE
jgi:hypothetical protein